MTTVLLSSVQIQLAQYFGKDSIDHSFYADKCFHHILVTPLKWFPILLSNQNSGKACQRTQQPTCRIWSSSARIPKWLGSNFMPTARMVSHDNILSAALWLKLCNHGPMDFHPMDTATNCQPWHLCQCVANPFHMEHLPCAMHPPAKEISRRSTSTTVTINLSSKIIQFLSQQL